MNRKRLRRLAELERRPPDARLIPALVLRFLGGFGLPLGAARERTLDMARHVVMGGGRLAESESEVKAADEKGSALFFVGGKQEHLSGEDYELVARISELLGEVELPRGADPAFL